MIRLACLLALATAPALVHAADLSALKQAVVDTEKAFAKTMADRNFAAFSTFIADDAVFEGGHLLRGKPAVLAAWKRLYTQPAAPFSWQPESVEVLESGNDVCEPAAAQ
jgi:ketosteroid isomerase-like protein